MNYDPEEEEEKSLEEYDAITESFGELSSALLILDEEASIDDIVLAYIEVNRRQVMKYGANGITVLANDEAIEGRESELAKRTNTQWLPDWKNNPVYRSMLKGVLKYGDHYVMKLDGGKWIVEPSIAASNYKILDPDGKINFKPKRD